MLAIICRIGGSNGMVAGHGSTVEAKYIRLDLRNSLCAETSEVNFSMSGSATMPSRYKPRVCVFQ